MTDPLTELLHAMRAGDEPVRLALVFPDGGVSLTIEGQPVADGLAAYLRAAGVTVGDAGLLREALEELGPEPNGWHHCRRCSGVDGHSKHCLWVARNARVDSIKTRARKALAAPEPAPPDAGLRALATEIAQSWTPDGEDVRRVHTPEGTVYVIGPVRATPAPTLDVEQLIEDGRKWQAAEAEGHVVTFSETGYGLMHPPSCRPDLIGCRHNKYLASRGYPEEEPGRYRMTLHKGHAEYVLTERPTS